MRSRIIVANLVGIAVGFALVAATFFFAAWLVS